MLFWGFLAEEYAVNYNQLNHSLLCVHPYIVLIVVSRHRLENIVGGFVQPVAPVALEGLAHKSQAYLCLL